MDPLIEQFVEAVAAVLVVLGGKAASQRAWSAFRAWLLGDIEARLNKLETKE